MSYYGHRARRGTSIPSAPKARSLFPFSERKEALPQIQRPLDLQPSTWNAAERTVDVVWTTGARAAKFDLETFDFVDEELATAPANVRLGRLNGGAPVLNAHDRSAMASQIGVVVPDSVRMQGGQGLATLKLSDREDVAPLVSDIAAGIMRNVSVGYVVHRYEMTQRPGDRPLYLATDWEPLEISFVPVPADPAAQVRSRTAGELMFPCTITRKAIKMPATIAQLRAITSQIGEHYRLDTGACAEIALDMAERGLEEHDARETMLQIVAERQRADTSAIGNAGRSIIENGLALLGGTQRNAQSFDNPTFLAQTVEDALYARLSGTKPTEAAREFMGLSMVQIAGAMLEHRGERSVRTMSSDMIISRASWNRGGSGDFVGASMRGAMTTSDFPDLLTAAGQRFLLEIFANAESPIKQFCKKRGVSDFRTISGIQLSGFGTLPETGEAGEVKHGSFTDRKETYRLKTFSKKYGLTRQAIINDDLGAFSDGVRVMTNAAAETEASILADLINSNPTMSDNKAVFHSAHGNLAGGGGALSVTTLGAARAAMRGQKDLDGVTPINPRPKFVLAGTDNETLLEQLLLAVTLPGVPDNANPFVGKLLPLVDPRIAGNAWYMFADPANVPALEYAYLTSAGEGPQIETKDGWDVLGTEFRVRLDFGAGWLDWRGAYKNSGQ